MCAAASTGASGIIDLGLAGAAVVVTGAGSGIGAATARLLGAAGASVTLVRPAPGTARADRRGGRKTGGRAVTMPADLADPATPSRVIAAAMAAFGRIDGLVNNAAMCQHRPLAGWDTAGFDEQLATNIRAPYFLIQAALPALRESRLRSVVNISSSSGTMRVSGQSVYGMTQVRAGLPDPVPGWRAGRGPDPGQLHRARTGRYPIHATWADDLDEAYRWLQSQVPLGRIGDPADLARWIALLLSPV